MIDYFMVPFPAPNDNEAMAGISHEVNRTDINAAIQTAPHHFELFSLGEIDENGTIFPKKELVCDCGSLIRARRTTTELHAEKANGTSREDYASTLRSGSHTGTNGETLRESTPQSHTAAKVQPAGP
ncbi:MAG: nonstructural protein [Arizlama microvirus]|nr:MAG: nonstructural protein [Arizlama microvirus]